MVEIDLSDELIDLVGEDVLRRPRVLARDVSQYFPRVRRMLGEQSRRIFWIVIFSIVFLEGRAAVS